MAINKARRQCLKAAGVDLKNDRFSRGQLYVACSRVSTSDSQVILLPAGRTKNIVYKELLYKMQNGFAQKEYFAHNNVTHNIF
ncbi:PIF1 helicase [Candidatus Regiella insecticola 5.15]|uniref:PIF1 helicase n=1 Tax=Candidatus Regiella insecticola 5.15 TaxID=1005043 RepID=G2GWZ5_9ENTR|nr:PIF1 helicase [Candidatus Regiella insecticola 5.15]